ncbi:hypothetical protein Q9Q94_05920 [Uliginosibacterium sp. 31-16]|uniref:hypothetical protein n=1 Tax=Uliginosibacterium sp. 31-16 TaxID=3068315 RepID=UPI00273FD7DD|nr:hypothetical protein [Uliginosibacterium sp. 31-16]MDP5239058.1 hypothetical protein [Uliginosibacterium sp. 31-16]
MRVLSGILILALGCSSAFAQRGPEDVVRDFYTARVASTSTGAPSGRELAEFSAHLGPELVCLLGAALRYDEKFAQAYPDDKPPFVEGDLYSSSFTAPTRFSLGKLQQKAGSASIPVHFYLDDTDKPDTTGWQDLVHLKIVRKHWAIADIEYQAGTSNKGTLFTSLREKLENAEPAAGWSVRELDSCTMDKVPAKGKTKAKAKTTGKTKAKAVAKPAAKAASKPTASKKKAH